MASRRLASYFNQPMKPVVTPFVVNDETQEARPDGVSGSLSTTKARLLDSFNFYGGDGSLFTATKVRRYLETDCAGRVSCRSQLQCPRKLEIVPPLPAWQIDNSAHEKEAAAADRAQ